MHVCNYVQLFNRAFFSPIAIVMVEQDEDLVNRSKKGNITYIRPVFAVTSVLLL